MRHRLRRRSLSQAAGWRPLALIGPLALLLLHALIAAPSGEATSAQEAIGFLNQQRAANGIAPLALDQSQLRSECTPENHHVASGSTSWSASDSPWSIAPFHQGFLYDPNAQSAAYGEYPTFGSSPGPWACMWFTWDFSVPSPTGAPAFYAFTDERGPSAVAPSVDASESPVTPAEVVGAENPTGPNLLVYALGIGANPTIAAASLTTDRGQPVAIRWVDGTSTYNGQAVEFAWRGVIVPVNPLDPLTGYHAHVTWRGNSGELFDQDFDFTTREGEPTPRIRPHLRLKRAVQRHGRILIRVHADQVLLGRKAQLSIAKLARRCGTTIGGDGKLHHVCLWAGQGRKHKGKLALRQGTTISAPQPGFRHWVIAGVKTKPFKIGGQRYAAARDHLTLR